MSNTPELTYIGEWVNPDTWDGDSIHQVYTGLKGGAELHRFVNKGGVPYSAIYLNGIECCNHERRKEAGLMTAWSGISTGCALRPLRITRSRFDEKGKGG